ncbi:aromatic ring-hydroxylating dioxygenase subunit alpha [Aquabacterium sp.]|uniref:aromatic ring-hydroxylating dioxygenase subunit alpha n=1 Tax=Aquabacterium sp. TaxID=1872578 RepID=UPI002BFF9E5B|nr:aromatic ring-hydroxylating dioxygenase subunit alpha [Aquabacterium sp.]HSW06565.1 aromatic ring-hydroxylating dioxygenase subunit alpha [Aquabacterium sp.]
MTPCRAADIAALVQDDRVHRDLYLSPALFALEQQHFFANTWQYLGHASQVPTAGDYLAVQIAGRPLLLVRQADGALRVLANRCAHKGTQLVSDASGNTGKFFRCPYHAWTYKLDGAPLAIPLKSGYENTRLKSCESGQGMAALRHVALYRDFVFVKLGDAGPDFHGYLGDALQALDNLADRSPLGRLRIEGGVLRSIVHCNWKMYLENINDTVHPMSTHESATAAANRLWQGQPADAPRASKSAMAMEQILPFGAGYDFFDRMGGRVYPNGHSVLGVNFSIHSGYAQLPDYEAAMRAAHGEARATEILQRSPQNALCFPSLAVKSSPQAIRVIRPLAVDRTLIEAWSFRAEGAPDILFERAMTYNRLVFSPMSVVAHDDVHLFESMQQGLQAEGNDWISLHRDFDARELEAGTQTVNGTNELLMRNQFRAWAKFMTLTMQD